MAGVLRGSGKVEASKRQQRFLKYAATVNVMVFVSSSSSSLCWARLLFSYVLLRLILSFTRILYCPIPIPRYRARSAAAAKPRDCASHASSHLAPYLLSYFPPSNIPPLSESAFSPFLFSPSSHRRSPLSTPQKGEENRPPNRR